VGSPHWTKGTPGSSVAIPLTAWTSGALTPAQWQVQNQAYVIASSANLGALQATIDSPSAPDPDGSCWSGAWFTNGTQATFTVEIPANAVQGDWAVIELYSFQEPSTCVMAPNADLGHIWFVGVYVP